MTSNAVYVIIVQVNTIMNVVFIIILGKRETGKEQLTDTLMKAISKTSMVQ